MNTFPTVLFLVLISSSWAAKILYVALTTSLSHTIWDKTLAMALRENHQVTFVSHGPVSSCENFTSLIFEGVLEEMHKEYVIRESFGRPPKGQIDVIFDWMVRQNLLDVKTQGLKNLLKLIESGAKFDAVVMDITTGHFMYPIIENLGFPPLVLTSAFGLQVFHSVHFGNSLYTSYVPLMMMEYTDQMTFFERVHNLFYAMYGLYVRQIKYMPAQFELAKQVFGENITSFDVIDKHASFLLTNTDFAFDYPHPLPPAIINVGGLHVKRVTELPKDLKKILDEAKYGVILFSLGTNIRADYLKREQREAFIRGMSKLKQTIILKFESEIANLPKNIIVRKWLPQNEILAHPNVKLFVTHGGALSIQEAIYHGVPVVGIPFFMDQILNMNKVINKKLGLKLNFQALSEDLVYDTISEVLNNQTYRNNMQLVSKRYRDQPQNALERAVFWVEYAIRNNGGQHLRIASRDMSLVQLYFLDLWALIFVILVATVYLIKLYIQTTTRNIKIKYQ